MEPSSGDPSGRNGEGGSLGPGLSPARDVRSSQGPQRLLKARLQGKRSSQARLRATRKPLLIGVEREGGSGHLPESQVRAC